MTPARGSAGNLDENRRRVLPILRWAGSKRRLLPVIANAVPEVYSRYIEPFAGSATVFLHLDPPSAVLSDLNGELIETYKTIRSDWVSVYSALTEFPRSKDLYYLLREVQPEDLDPISRAARFVYLNRYSFNGVYRTNKDGRYNVPMGTRTGELPSKEALGAFARRLTCAQLRTGDFEDVLAMAQHGDLVYLDPPYSRFGARFRGEYGYGAFSSFDERRLVRSMIQAARRGASLLLSYNDEIARAFDSWTVRRLRVQRSVAGFSQARKPVSEILVSNY